MGAHPPIDFAQLPGLEESWRLGVICGGTASGKTSALQTLSNHFRLGREQPLEDPISNKAICSYEALHGGNVSSISGKFQAVAMHSLPTRVKPQHVLSQGELERFQLACLLKPGGSVQDNRFAVVDAETAQSMCTALHRYLCEHDCGKILLATCQTSLVPFLQPDFVVEMRPDSCQVHRNPDLSGKVKRPIVTIHTDVERFVEGQGGGWRGAEGVAGVVPVAGDASLDDLPLAARGRRIPKASVQEEYAVEVQIDEFTKEVSKAFDYVFTGRITQKGYRLKHEALSFPWSIGAIIGPSGSGKSTNLKHFGEGPSFEWSDSASVWDQLPCDDKKKLLEVVTLSEATCRRSIRQLSAGERSLAQLARLLGSAVDGQMMPVDEFTSLLDRHRAYEVCRNLSSFIRESGRRLVVAGCHKDVVDWLQPGWVFCADSGEVIVPEVTGASPPAHVDVSFEVPKIELIMRRLATNKQSVDVFNSHFAAHHYMEGNVPSNIYGQLIRTTSGDLVGYHGVSQQPGAVHHAMREARIVILPQWQGHGIGPKVSALVGQQLKSSGLRLFCKTSQEALGLHRMKADHLWRPTNCNLKLTTQSLAEGFAAKKRRKQEAAERLRKEQEAARKMENDQEARDEEAAKKIENHEGAVPEPLEPRAADEVEPAAVEMPPPEFNPDCTACCRERDGLDGVKAKGRPPKHSCGRTGAAKPACIACIRERDGTKATRRPRKHTCGRPSQLQPAPVAQAPVEGSVEFSDSCTACRREHDGLRPAGRPPKHTCGRPSAPAPAPLLNDVSRSREPVRRVCYSHEYVGPARPKRSIQEVAGVDTEATSKMIKMMADAVATVEVTV